MPEPIDTSKLGPIKIEPGIRTRAKLLEYVNELNMKADAGISYWTVTVVYNTVIWRRDERNRCAIVQVYEGVLK